MEPFLGSVTVISGVWEILLMLKYIPGPCFLGHGSKKILYVVISLL